MQSNSNGWSLTEQDLSWFISLVIPCDFSCPVRPQSSVWRICTYNQPNKHANDLIAGYEQLVIGDTLWASGWNQSPPAEKHLEIYKYLHLITSHLEPSWTHCTLNTPSERKRDIWPVDPAYKRGDCCLLLILNIQRLQAGTYNRCTEIQHELLNTSFTSCLLFLMHRCRYLRINRLTHGYPWAL